MAPRSITRRNSSSAQRVSVAMLASGAMLVTAGLGVAAPVGPKNQAVAADTVVASPDEADTTGDTEGVRKALRSVGLSKLDRIALVDATVDPDGCMRAPLAVERDEPSAGLQALADAMRRRGVAVPILDGAIVRAIDDAQQRRVRALKGSFQLTFGEGDGRWLATKAELVACTRIDDEVGAAQRNPHAALAALLAALGQDAVVAVGASQAESKGAKWNVIEGELSSDGKSLDAATSSAEIQATLVLKDGSAPWSANLNTHATLQPPVEQAAVARLAAYLNGELRKLKTFRVLHPNADEPAGLLDAAFEAIASGDLDAAPSGTTVGPSAKATLEAAAERLVGKLAPVLPARPAANGEPFSEL